MFECVSNRIINLIIIVYYFYSVFPKTDYTYSPTSQCRYEVAPGVLAMPNMSRRPIHSDELSPIPVIDTFTSEADISDTKELLMRNVPVSFIFVFFLLLNSF